MEENHEKDEPQSAASERESLVEELYALADEVLRQYSQRDTGEELRSMWVAQRLARLTQAHLDGDVFGVRGGPHDWLLDAIDDIAAYAEREGLAEIHDFFVDAKFVVFGLLKSSRDGARQPTPASGTGR